MGIGAGILAVVAALLMAIGCGEGTGRSTVPAGRPTANAVHLSGTATPAARVLIGRGAAITPDFDGQTVQPGAGVFFLVQMGRSDERGDAWSLDWCPAGAVHMQESAGIPLGSQGYWVIDRPGTTVMLTAIRSPFCLTPTAGAPPRTPAPRTVRVTIVASGR